MKLPLHVQPESPRSRLDLLFGEEAINKLERSCIMIFGVGGVGSNCIEALARGRVGKFILIDHDYVSSSNINRQAIALHSTIGQAKVEVMKQRIIDINPRAQVVSYQDFMKEDDLEPLIRRHREELDYVIDAIDTVSAKLRLAELAQLLDFPFISSMGGGNKIFPESLRICDIYETHHCPLCKIIRKEARKRKIGSIEVLYSSEQPYTLHRVQNTRERSLSLGTASFMPAIMGQRIAAHVIKQLIGCTQAPSASSLS